MKKIITLLILVICIVTSFQLWNSLKDEPIKKKNYKNEVLQLLKRKYKTINVTFPKYSDPSTQIQKALDLAKNSKKPIKVVIPPGDYTLTTSLHIYSNTWLQASNKTIFRKATTHREIMLLNGDFKASYYNYDGNSNIVVDGGKWDASGATPTLRTPSVFGFAHGHNILVQNTIVKNIVGGHAIDSSGNKNVIIQNNKFLGTRLGNDYFTEAIQIDGMVSEKAFRRFGTVDLTVTKNMIIDNNYFGNSHVKGMKPWGVGVGSHSAAYKKPYTNIQITNNTFDGMTYAAIRGFNWSNILIKSNHFLECEQGILINGYGPYYYMKNGKDYQSQGELINSNIRITSNIFKPK
jgi:hypothetical protein